MADNMKEYYRGIETDDRELAGYRAKLGERLNADRGWLRPWRGLAAAVVLAAVLLWFFLPRSGFPQRDLEALQTMTAHQDPDRLRREARALLNGNGPTLDRWNAYMVLCLIEPDEKAAQAAAQGLLLDPRPEFRVFYLEYLLDRADEYQYNLPLIEDRMDHETDKLCLRLYKQLLHLASS